jgi:hypothetical protein
MRFTTIESSRMIINKAWRASCFVVHACAWQWHGEVVMLRSRVARPVARGRMYPERSSYILYVPPNTCQANCIVFMHGDWLSRSAPFVLVKIAALG